MSTIGRTTTSGVEDSSPESASYANYADALASRGGYEYGHADVDMGVA